MAVTKNTKGNRQEYHYWDYSFEWTSQHLPPSQLEPWVRRCDTLADDCTRIINKLPKPAAAAPSDGSILPSKDSYALLRDKHKDSPRLGELWNEINTVPDWVDWDQIERGQDIYWRYFIPISNAVRLFHLVAEKSCV
jgi:hypothetical protein